MSAVFVSVWQCVFLCVQVRPEVQQSYCVAISELISKLNIIITNRPKGLLYVHVSACYRLSVPWYTKNYLAGLISDW